MCENPPPNPHKQDPCTSQPPSAPSLTTYTPFRTLSYLYFHLPRDAGIKGCSLSSLPTWQRQSPLQAPFRALPDHIHALPNPFISMFSPTAGRGHQGLLAIVIDSLATAIAPAAPSLTPAKQLNAILKRGLPLPWGPAGVEVRPNDGVWTRSVKQTHKAPKEDAKQGKQLQITKEGKRNNTRRTKKDTVGCTG